MANALLGLGLQRGRPRRLLAYNCVEWMEIYAALARAGLLVAVPINFPPQRAGDRTSPAQHAEARAFVVQDDYARWSSRPANSRGIPNNTRFISFGATEPELARTTRR